MAPSFAGQFGLFYAKAAFISALLFLMGMSVTLGAMVEDAVIHAVSVDRQCLADHEFTGGGLGHHRDDHGSLRRGDSCGCHHFGVAKQPVLT